MTTLQIVLPSAMWSFQIIPDNSSFKIANPFASKERIQQKIHELLEIAILEASNANDGFVTIKCDFGNNLELYSCSVIPILK